VQHPLTSNRTWCRPPACRCSAWWACRWSWTWARIRPTCTRTRSSDRWPASRIGLVVVAVRRPGPAPRRRTPRPTRVTSCSSSWRMRVDYDMHAVVGRDGEKKIGKKAVPLLKTWQQTVVECSEQWRWRAADCLTTDGLTTVERRRGRSVAGRRDLPPPAPTRSSTTLPPTAAADHCFSSVAGYS